MASMLQSQFGVESFQFGVSILGFGACVLGFKGRFKVEDLVSKPWGGGFVVQD